MTDGEKVTVRPRGDRVLVRPADLEDPDAQSQIIRPDLSEDAPEAGVVTAVGPKVDGLAEGDVVVFGRYSGFGVMGDDTIILRDSDVVAIVSGAVVRVRERGERRRAVDEPALRPIGL